jgi:predicted nucleotidyltransferase
MRDAEEVRDELAALKPHLQAEYPIDELGIFGSYAREEQRSDSDLDVVVSFERPVTLFDLVRLEDELTRRLDVEVDLITRDSLKPQIETRVAEDVIY